MSDRVEEIKSLSELGRVFLLSYVCHDVPKNTWEHGMAATRAFEEQMAARDDG